MFLLGGFKIFFLFFCRGSKIRGHQSTRRSKVSFLQMKTFKQIVLHYLVYYNYDLYFLYFWCRLSCCKYELFKISFVITVYSLWNTSKHFLSLWKETPRHQFSIALFIRTLLILSFFVALFSRSRQDPLQSAGPTKDLPKTPTFQAKPVDPVKKLRAAILVDAPAFDPARKRRPRVKAHQAVLAIGK